MASDNVFCIGNGESRKHLNLESLRPFGKIYGCNALYRDFLPDAITAVDHGIMHEIYHAGVANKIPCYFRDWTKLPSEMYDHVVMGGCNMDEVEFIKQFALIENERKDSDRFVIHGANLNSIKKNIEQNKKYPNKIHTRISWIQKPDYSYSINDLMQPKDRGWACGATSAFMAIIHETPRRIYMIGHDLNSTTSKINNLYKNTDNYNREDHHPTPSVNWIKQWRELMREHPHIQFIKVNTHNNGGDEVNKPIEEWNLLTNLKYIDYQELDNLLKV